MRDIKIDVPQLYEKLEKLERQAMDKVIEALNEGDMEKYKNWSLILQERTFFKKDIARTVFENTFI